MKFVEERNVINEEKISKTLIKVKKKKKKFPDELFFIIGMMT